MADEKSQNIRKLSMRRALKQMEQSPSFFIARDSFIDYMPTASAEPIGVQTDDEIFYTLIS